MTVEAAFRAAGLLATGALFGLLVFERHCARASDLAAVRRWLIGLALVAGLAALLEALFPARQIAPALRWAVLGLRLLGLGLAGATAQMNRPREALVAAGLALIGLPALSRFGAGSGGPAALLSALVHVLAASVWLGGVLGLARRAPAVVAAPDAAHISAFGAALRRFSPLAVAATLALTLTGLAQANSTLSGPEALIETAYGRVLLAKLIGFAVLLGFGALHQQVLGPRLSVWRGRAEAGAAGAARALRHSLVLELVVGALTVLLAAVLGAWPLAAG